MNTILLIGVILLLTLISGWADSRGFLYASSVWNHNKIMWMEVIKSFFWFGIGIIPYLIAVKFLKEIGIISPEVQFAGWFIVTIVGIAVSSGRFVHWQLIDQIVAFIVVMCIAWLYARVGG